LKLVPDEEKGDPTKPKKLPSASGLTSESEGVAPEEVPKYRMSKEDVRCYLKYREYIESDIDEWLTFFQENQPNVKITKEDFLSEIERVKVSFKK
jgi:hypothetical protein